MIDHSNPYPAASFDWQKGLPEKLLITPMVARQLMGQVTFTSEGFTVNEVMFRTIPCEVVDGN